MAGRAGIGGVQSKLYEINWLLPLLIFLVGCVGVAMIYSATGGQWNLGAKQHLIRLIVGMLLMLTVAMIDIRVWFTLAYPAYLAALVLLIGVEFFGVSVNGSQRWLDLFVVRIQPSEFMKWQLCLRSRGFTTTYQHGGFQNLSGYWGRYLSSLCLWRLSCGNRI